CGQVLDYSHLPPRFCSNCGQPLRVATPPVLVDQDTPTRAAAAGTQALDPEGTVAYPAPRGPAPAHPATVGGYRLLRPLGGGGMGTVYEAEERHGGRHVALKLIRPEFADSPDALERFRREGRLAGTISHPRCVFVIAADEEQGRPYIAMELMPGSNLADLV